MARMRWPAISPPRAVPTRKWRHPAGTGRPAPWSTAAMANPTPCPQAREPAAAGEGRVSSASTPLAVQPPSPASCRPRRARPAPARACCARPRAEHLYAIRAVGAGSRPYRCLEPLGGSGLVKYNGAFDAAPIAMLTSFLRRYWPVLAATAVLLPHALLFDFV